MINLLSFLLAYLMREEDTISYPFQDDLSVAKNIGDAGTFQTLGGYRLDKNLEAVRATEEDAKIDCTSLTSAITSA